VRLAGGEDLSRAIERVAQLGAQLLLQSALEAEVTAFLGRDRYERAAASEDPRVGMRNGYCLTTVKTTAGPITLSRTKVRGTTERFASRLFGKGVTKTNALESLVIAGFVRGLSTRDVEAESPWARASSARSRSSHTSCIASPSSAGAAPTHKVSLPPRRQIGYHSSLTLVTAAGAFRGADGNIGGGVLNEAILYYRQTFHINGWTISPGARNYGRSRDWGEEVAVIADVATDACSSRARLRFASSTRIVVMCRMIEMGTM
jgi:putative transposase